MPFSSPGDLPDPGIEPGSPALQSDSLLSNERSRRAPCLSACSSLGLSCLRFCTFWTRVTVPRPTLARFFSHCIFKYFLRSFSSLFSFLDPYNANIGVFSVSCIFLICASILFLKYWIIFTIITLNFFYDEIRNQLQEEPNSTRLENNMP